MKKLDFGIGKKIREKKKIRKSDDELAVFFSRVTCNIYFRTFLTFYCYYLTFFFLAGILVLYLYSIPADILLQNPNEISKSTNFLAFI